ncbi:hypothetical protein [Labedaea rhizosphaerae]|uniref:Uncharacterized protein n=1 Tax=Labedaea rhizosphaerae TaxID=598644 RepID=A0A4R6RZ18_LABRH|nr:hypothetical protein [Labedaea rhizosphaerae]TDP91837.1 hypothetical protein EV186_10846 [Labedaea rhizosphaerae]
MRTGTTTLAVISAGTALAAGLFLPGTAATAPISAHWTAADVASTNNVATTAGVATLANPAMRPALNPNAAGYGTETLVPRTLPAPVSAVRVDADTVTPAGTSATVEVRGQRANGGWTEWRAASANTVLGTATRTVQARITLRTNTSASPSVRRVTVTPVANTPAPKAVQPRSETFSVFATREGLVGGTTANGHVITVEDHFVALPSGTALASNGGTEYQVQVCNGATCLTEPVWDIGPWNTKDNYWDAARAEFGDLPVGLPEADAAYNQGYNGGLDEFGRSVANPAGIDLADGVFHDLGMADNGYVTVTYLWTA